MLPRVKKINEAAKYLAAGRCVKYKDLFFYTDGTQIEYDEALQRIENELSGLRMFYYVFCNK